ncbi:DBND1 protein, partial [Chordeiles acutipennis]|nr:DBND1 protein [Chordeiles acutipennis]
SPTPQCCVAELSEEVQPPEPSAGTPTHGPAPEPPGAPAEEPGGIPIPSASLLQVTERRRDVSSLEVHFDLLDLTELTDMSDQELAEVFADSDEENVPGDSPGGRPPRAGYLRSPSWTRVREKQHLGDPQPPPGPPDTPRPTDRPRDP